jgi:apolipoprotein N-acyltransferase
VTRTLSEAGGKELFFPGTAESAVVLARSGPTLFNLYGDYFIWICWSLVLLGAVLYFMDRL